MSFNISSKINTATMLILWITRNLASVIVFYQIPEECEMRHSYRKCERCTEAVLYELFDQHKSDTCNREYCKWKSYNFHQEHSYQREQRSKRVQYSTSNWCPGNKIWSSIFLILKPTTGQSPELAQSISHPHNLFL